MGSYIGVFVPLLRRLRYPLAPFLQVIPLAVEADSFGEFYRESGLNKLADAPRQYCGGADTCAPSSTKKGTDLFIPPPHLIEGDSPSKVLTSLPRGVSPFVICYS